MVMITSEIEIASVKCATDIANVSADTVRRTTGCMVSNSKTLALSLNLSLNRSILMSIIRSGGGRASGKGSANFLYAILCFFSGPIMYQQLPCTNILRTYMPVS